MKRFLLLFSIVALVSSFLIIPAFAAESIPVPIRSIDLTYMDAGLFTAESFTNYYGWCEFENSAVFVSDENGSKHINVVDNDDACQPTVYLQYLDFGNCVSTIAFDLKINGYGSEYGPVLEICNRITGSSYVRIDFDENLFYFADGRVNLPCTGVLDQWISVVLVVDGINNNYTFYYDGDAVITDAPPRTNSVGGFKNFGDEPLTIEVRSDKASVGCNYDVRNFAVYAGDQSSALLSQPDQTAGSVVSSFTQVFGSVGSWIAGQLGSTTSLFWNAGTGTLTFLGILAVCALALAVILLLVFVVVRFLRFRG